MEILNEKEGRTGFFCTAHCAQKLVAHFHNNMVATKALKGKQVQMTLPKKNIGKSCATRWNSQLAMLECLPELRWPITAVLSDKEEPKQSDCYLDLKTEQWTLAEDLGP